MKSDAKQTKVDENQFLRSQVTKSINSRFNIVPDNVQRLKDQIDSVK